MTKPMYPFVNRLPVIIWPRGFGKSSIQREVQAEWDKLGKRFQTMGAAARIAEQAMRRFRQAAYAGKCQPVALKPAHKHGKHRGWR